MTTERLFYTQTLDNSYKRFSNKKQVLATLPMIHSYLRQFTSDYILYPELTQAGMIHFHGILTLKDKVKQYKLRKKMSDELGFLKIDSIKDLQASKDYISKEAAIMQDVLGVKLPYTYEDNEKLILTDKLKKKLERLHLEEECIANDKGIFAFYGSERLGENSSDQV